MPAMSTENPWLATLRRFEKFGERVAATPAIAPRLITRSMIRPDGVEVNSLAWP